MSTRIYVITNRTTSAQRLVRAASPAQAIRHVASEAFGAAVAAQDTLVGLVSAGVKVETAREPDSVRESGTAQPAT